MQLVGTLGAVASLAVLVSLWSSIEELESPFPTITIAALALLGFGWVAVVGGVKEEVPVSRGGVDVEREGRRLYVAAETDDLSTLTSLAMQHSGSIAVLNWSEPDNIDRSPFWISCSEGKVKAAALLASIRGVDINKTTLASETPLYAAAQNGHIAIVELLVSLPQINLDKANIINKTPLMVAANDGIKKLISRALEQHRK